MGYYDDYLEHHGIKGQKWGVRRFQNADGTLTEKGQKRYGEKVTMHNGKNGLMGKRKYQTHKEYVTADKYAKGTYLQRKQEIKDQKKKDLEKADTFGKKVGANFKAMQKNADNRAQYQYEKDRNRVNAGVHELTRDTVKGAVKRGAAATAVVGAGIVAGMLHANYMNNSSKRKAAGALPMSGMDNYYEYSVGKKQVAKYIGKAVALGALYGAAAGVNKNVRAMDRVESMDNWDKEHNVKNSRNKRATEDEKRWKKGQV